MKLRFSAWGPIVAFWAFCLTPLARGEQPLENIDGVWFRVYEKCNAPLVQVPDFSAGGGDAFVGRRMILHLDGEEFSTEAMASLRCGRDDAPQKHEDDNQAMDCIGSRSRGRLSRDATTLHFDAIQTTAGNNWGSVFRDYDFRLLGDVLELTQRSYTSNCGFAPMHIYFVRYPGS